MYIILALIVIAVWLTIMGLLLMPKNTISNAWDRVTSGRYRADRVNLQIMLDHLRSFPDEWSIQRGGASFPKEGAKQIYLNYDNGWEYTLASFDDRKARPLEGYFGKEFASAIMIENNRRERESLIRNFYPGLEGPLLLK